MDSVYDNPALAKDAAKRSKSLTGIIRKEIAAQGGHITFDAFMQMALYHPELGYYSTNEFNIGRHGDFTTAPELSPLFARCFAHQVMQAAAALNTSAILEIGAGSGRFAKELLLELQRRCQGQILETYYILEISPALRKKQRALLQAECPELLPHVKWLDSLPEKFRGTIIANELLDAMPVHRFRVDKQGIKECCVTWHKENFAWQACDAASREMTDKAAALASQYHLPAGYESEFSQRIPAFIQELGASLEQGLVLLADYGYGQQEYYHPARSRGSLTCFYQHRKHDNPLIMPGLQDMTAHVNFTQVIESAVENGFTLCGYTYQAAFLLSCGLSSLIQEEEKKLSKVDQFKLQQTVKLLTMPTEMGDRVKVMALAKGLETELMGFKTQDRRRDL